MEAVILTFILILGIVFTFSFVILIFLCHYKTIRKNATRYVKKLARTDLRHKDTELIEKKTGLVKRFLRNSCNSNGALSERCQQLLDLCYGLDLTSNRLTQPDIQKIHAIVQMAQSITEDSDDWTCPEGREKAGLLEKRAAGLLQQVASVMSAMEAHLSAIKESSVIEEIKSCSYQNSLII
ncbi:unnamed protein product [Nezara viridula]|uniref:Uncharacterized protein n=1 Tax=Nezara viridula TaxID=85310 RepID=A0A9P0EHA0_NEZVI|nr:unnamed protein product [Nezara viridula]